MTEIFILKYDLDGTLRSTDKPTGFAVRTEAEAIAWVESTEVGYSHSYEKIEIVDSLEDIK